MTTPMRASIQYQLRDYRTSGLILFGVNVILILLAILGMFSVGINGEISYTAYGFSAAIFMLVCGIVTARQVIRLCAQMGTGRKTAFLSLLPSAVLASLAIAAAGEVLMAAAQAVSIGYPNLYFNDLYGLIYAGFDTTLSVGQHIISALFNTCLMLACYGFGLFCTALFWRLNKIGKVIAGIAMAACFIFGPPLLSIYVQVPMMLLMEFFIASPWNGMAVFLVIFLFFTGISWLLVRNVNIRGWHK